jgi:hypothetical protein
MADLLYAITPLAVGAVAVVLLLGILNLARSGSAETSQKLMQWRVALQALAIVIIVFAIWAKSG